MNQLYQLKNEVENILFKKKRNKKLRLKIYIPNYMVIVGKHILI